ncbi:unnamed protein product [Effrenium voratum]|nr:unnamed protein product [Effrenium voratum]
MDVALARQLLSEGLVLESLDTEALGPWRARVEALRPAVAAVLAATKAAPAGPAAEPRGAAVAPLPGRGRALLAGQSLKRGQVVLREQALARVPLPKKLDLHPQTQLALKLWEAERSDQRLKQTELLDHGKDAGARKLREVIAACCALCCDRPQEVESLFRWLGRVRVNAVTVSCLVESDGEMEHQQVALALYPELARSVNHSCRPNAILRFDSEDLVELVVSSPVPAGEEVMISYGPTASTMPRSKRQAALLAEYGFECLCSACASVAHDENFQWKLKAQMLDDRARAAVGRAAWQEAAIACSAAVSMLREGYREGDVELAREEPVDINITV